MTFLGNLNKDLSKAGIDAGSSSPPSYWFGSGNHVLNKILSGSFFRFVPQGRIICLAGPSGAGKSFVLANIIREALKQGAFVVPIDSENALDDDFMTNVGVDVKNENYMYVPVNTMEQCKKTVSKLVQNYEIEYKDDLENAPRLVMAIDSLDMLMSSSEEENFKKGIIKGDMGQRNKQLKSMLRSFVQAIKKLNISIIVTHQVYRNQDLMNGKGLWVVAEAVEYSLSQIVLLTKLKLKSKDKKQTTGIRMICEGFKTRFTQPFQRATIEVPYDKGMDPFNGLLGVAVDMGIVTHTKGSSLYYHGKNKFKEKEFDRNLQESVLEECEAQRSKFLEVLDEEDEEDLTPQQSAKKKRSESYKEER